jgi:hypothetical protein
LLHGSSLGDHTTGTLPELAQRFDVAISGYALGSLFARAAFIAGTSSWAASIFET